MVKHLFPVLFLPFPIGNCSFGTLTSIKLQSLSLDKFTRSFSSDNRLCKPDAMSSLRSKAPHNVSFQLSENFPPLFATPITRVFAPISLASSNV